MIKVELYASQDSFNPGFKFYDDFEICHLILTKEPVTIDKQRWYIYQVIETLGE